MTIVKQTRTPLSDKDLLTTLSLAYFSEFGETIPRARLAVLWSVLALEHGAGSAPVPKGSRAAYNLFCWNFGNRRGGEGDAGAYIATAGEILDGKPVPILGRWPAFTTAEQGMRSWLRMMSTRFKAAWLASLTGNALGYALAAKAGRYYTAPALAYAAGVRTWMILFRKAFPPGPTVVG